MRNVIPQAIAWSALTLGLPSQHWRSLAPALSPSPRSGHAMVWDGIRHRVVLFGGSGANDTWSWNGQQWQPLPSGNAPAGRSGHAMAYDSVRDRVVLFGGQRADGAYLQDVWEWDGVNWVPRILPSYPPARTDHAMVFDSTRSRLVMFGGRLDEPCNVGLAYADTWEWQGVGSWSLASSSSGPTARYGHSMAFDSVLSRALLYGGRNLADNCWGQVHFDQMWAWDGVQWLLLPSSGNTPGGLMRGSMAYDARRSRAVAFGGHTWDWDGTGWIRPNPLGEPASRSASSMVWDPDRSEVMMFGGRDGNTGWPVGGTYVWGGQSALVASYGVGCGSPPLVLESFAGSRPVSGGAQEVIVTNCPAGVAFLAVGLSSLSVGPFPLPFDLYGYGAPGCFVWHDCLYEFARGCSVVGASTCRGSYPIPSATWLQGVHLFLQAWAPAPGQNSAQLVTSNGLDLLLGNQ